MHSAGGGNVGQLQLQARGFRDAEQALDDVGLDGDEQDFHLPGGGGTQNLIVPDDLSQGKGTFCWASYWMIWGDLGDIHRRQLDELGENVEPRRRRR